MWYVSVWGRVLILFRESVWMHVCMYVSGCAWAGEDRGREKDRGRVGREMGREELDCIPASCLFVLPVVLMLWHISQAFCLGSERQQPLVSLHSPNQHAAAVATPSSQTATRAVYFSPKETCATHRNLMPALVSNSYQSCMQGAACSRLYRASLRSLA